MLFSLMISSGKPVDWAIKNAKLAEKYGFYGCFVSKDLFKRDSWIILTAIAAHTKEIKLGTCVVNPVSVDPAEIAMSAATLDEFSQGRVLLGISCGIRALAKIGYKRRKPVTRTREAVRIIRSLLSGKKTRFQGKIFKNRSDDAYLLFKPPRKHIPIYIAAHKPKMLQLIGELGDGGIALTYPPEDIETSLKYIHKGAENVGRDPKSIDVIAFNFGFIAYEEKETRKAIKESFVKNFWKPYLEALNVIGLTPSDFLLFETALERSVEPPIQEAKDLISKEFMKFGIAGTPEDWIERIEELEKSVNHVMIWLRQRNIEKGIRIIGEEVMPHFK